MRPSCHVQCWRCWGEFPLTRQRAATRMGERATGRSGARMTTRLREVSAKLDAPLASTRTSAKPRSPCEPPASPGAIDVAPGQRRGIQRQEMPHPKGGSSRQALVETAGPQRGGFDLWCARRRQRARRAGDSSMPAADAAIGPPGVAANAHRRAPWCRCSAFCGAPRRRPGLRRTGAKGDQRMTAARAPEVTSSTSRRFWRLKSGTQRTNCFRRVDTLDCTRGSGARRRHTPPATAEKICKASRIRVAISEGAPMFCVLFRYKMTVRVGACQRLTPFSFGPTQRGLQPGSHAAAARGAGAP